MDHFIHKFHLIERKGMAVHREMWLGLYFTQYHTMCVHVVFVCQNVMYSIVSITHAGMMMSFMFYRDGIWLLYMN